MAERTVIELDTPPLGGLKRSARAHMVVTSGHEALVGKADLEDSTIQSCAVKTTGVDVEKSEVTITVKPADDEDRYLAGSELFFLSLWVYYKSIIQDTNLCTRGLLLSIFLGTQSPPVVNYALEGRSHTTVALDQNIVATALPAIGSHFNALDSATWIVSAHFLTVRCKSHFTCLSVAHTTLRFSKSARYCRLAKYSLSRPQNGYISPLLRSSKSEPCSVP
jgi:hypothetical protein